VPTLEVREMMEPAVSVRPSALVMSKPEDALRLPLYEGCEPEAK